MLNYHHIEPDLTEEDFKKFQEFIYQRSGIYVDESHRDTLRISLLARTAAKNLGDYNHYYHYLKFHPNREKEFRELMSLITITETSFFRNREHFDILKNHVLPEIIKHRDGNKDALRIWSAGCSIGAEPYSIAMTLSEFFCSSENPMLEILATDVSEKALEEARRGVYTERALRFCEPRERDSYFKKTPEGKYGICDRIKKMVQFRYFNLIEEPYPLSRMGYWDVIFCRNVTIYFKPESTKRVIHNFYNSLSPGGYLFIGYSETLQNITSEFYPIATGGSFIYKKEPPQTRGSPL